MNAALSLTIISSFQTAWHNSHAFSMNPYGLQVSGANTPDFVSNDPVFVTSCSSEPNTDNYLNMSNIIKNMPSSETGDGGYLDSREWTLLDIPRKTDFRGRIHVGEDYIETDIRVYVSDAEYDIEICKHYILLPESLFKEVRKSRIKKHIGEPIKVQNTGDIWLGSGNKNKYVKIFVREAKRND